MMQQKILIYGDDRLRKLSENLINKDQSNPLIHQLFETLSIYGGIGLASPQIGVNENVFVIDTFNQIKNDPNEQSIKRAFINPQIVWYSKKQSVFNEGCLSIPYVYENVIRPESIKVQYLNESFEQVEETMNGITARVFQHEFDHLQGILFIDRLNMFQKIRIAPQLNKVKKNKSNYRVL